MLSNLMRNLPGIAYRCLNVPEMTALYISDGSSELTGYERAEMTGNNQTSYAQIIEPQDRERLSVEVQAALAAKRPYELEYRIRHKDGSIRWVRDVGKVVSPPDIKPEVFEGFVIDITKQKNIENSLRESKEKYKTITETLPGVVYQCRADWSFQFASDPIEELTGYPASDFIDNQVRSYESIMYRKDIEHVEKTVNKAIKAGKPFYKTEYRIRHKNGEIRWVYDSVRIVYKSEGVVDYFEGIILDITLRKKFETNLEHISHHDALTDLPNRLLLQERLRRAVQRADRQGSQLAVIYLDLDRFKLVNDSFGHPLGDQLLEQVADRLKQNVRENDTLARIGGDEFIMVMEGVTNPELLGNVAEKLIAIFVKPFYVDNREIRITASLGIAVFPEDGRKPTTLLRNADAAMYRAKDQGANSYQFYTRELTHNALKRMALESNLSRALERNELFLVYQPQVDLTTGKIIGTESLLRWRNPALGIVPPDKFIPLAEETGLIHEIGEWVLNEACQQGKQWLDKGIEFGHIAVNIAGPQVHKGDLPNKVSDALARSHLPPENLELEVTEGCFIMQDPEFSIKQLNTLRSLGIKLSIDDFGTGYSSLSYLKRLPIDKLKIDQSFVREIPENTDDMAIADAVIAMGNSLNLDVIAEGVETEVQADFLREHQCEQAQGYLYSKPVTAEEFEAFYRDNQKE